MKTFISHATQDELYAELVKQTMAGFGIDSFVEHRDLTDSEECRQRVVDELIQSDVFVALLSRNYRASPWCDHELGFAVSRQNVPIILFSLDDTRPYGLVAHLQSRDLNDATQGARTIESVILRKCPRLTIPVQIERIRTASSPQTAEVAVRPLIPIFALFSEDEISAFVLAVTENSAVWEDPDCRTKYLPRFQEMNFARMTEEDQNRFASVADLRPHPDLGRLIRMRDLSDDQ